MRNWFVLSLLVCSTLALGQASSSSAPQDLSSLNGRQEPPMLGIHWARGFDPFARSNEAHSGFAGGKRTPNMTYHGGKIMPTADSKIIFWGPSWGSYSGDEIIGMDSLPPATAATRSIQRLLPAGARPRPFWAKFARSSPTQTPAGMATMPFMWTFHAATRATAPITAREPAAGYQSSSPSSGSSMATLAAIRRIQAGFTQKAWLRSRTSVATSCLRHAAIPPVQGPGTTVADRKMATSAPGHSMFPWYPSQTAPNGKSRVNGPMLHSPTARDTRTAQDKRAASTGTE